MSAWRVIDCIDFDGTISSARGQIVLNSHSTGPTNLPVADLAVVLVGPKACFSAASMHRLLAADVVVLHCDWKGVPEGAAYAWSQHTRVGARHLAQAQLSLPRRKNAWGRIVRAKILGQAHNLALNAPDVSARLVALAKSVRSGDPENLEAQAARLYWPVVFELPLLRTPSINEGLNSCLNYAYTVLRGFGIRAVLSAGLAPALGLFHRGRSNAFNLVDDLIEPYRPAVDAVVADLEPEASTEDRTIRRRLVAGATQTFESDGATIPASLARLAQALGKYAEGEIQRLPVSVWAGSEEKLRAAEISEW